MFRLGRWSSHIREHTVQVEKTLVMIGHAPTEVDRLIRLILAEWGRAEAVVYGSAEAREAVSLLAVERVRASRNVTGSDGLEHVTPARALVIGSTAESVGLGGRDDLEALVKAFAAFLVWDSVAGIGSGALLSAK